MNTPDVIELCWYATCVSMIVLYWASHLWPKRVFWLQSNPWAFQTAQMNDLEFQSVLCATYHTRGFSQITHLSIVPDQFTWFMLLFLWSPWAVAVATVGLTLQAFRLR